MVTELFPASWFDVALLDLVVAFLANLPIDPEDKKRAIMEWAEEVGLELTGEIVERVTGVPAGEV